MPVAEKCSGGADCAPCATAPKQQLHCGYGFEQKIHSQDVDGVKGLVPRLCNAFNNRPVEPDYTLLSEQQASCEMLLYSADLSDCLASLQQLSCSYYCQECIPNESPKGLIKLCNKHCRAAIAVCQPLIDAGKIVFYK